MHSDKRGAAALASRLALLALLGGGAAQYETQVLIEPTIDPRSIKTEVFLEAGDGQQVAGFTDDKGDKARFNRPSGGVLVGQTLYVTDVSNHAIRSVQNGGEARTVAGGGGHGFADGYGGGAKFFNPRGIDVGPDGSLYVADSSNDAVREVTQGGVVTTLYRRTGYASSEPRMSAAAAEAAAAALATAEALADERGVEVGSGSDMVQVGTPAVLPPAIAADGRAMPQGLWNPQGVAVWPGSGNAVASVLVADTDNHRILQLLPPSTGSGEGGGATWELHHFAGSGEAGFVDGAAAEAQFRYPKGLKLCADEEGNYQLLVADSGNHAIRMVSYGGGGPASAAVSTFAGDGMPGEHDSRTRREKPKASVLLVSRLDAQFALPVGVTCDATSAGGVIVADTANHRIRKIRKDGVTVTLAGGAGRGYKDGKGHEAWFNEPSGVAMYGDEIYVVERGNNGVRKVKVEASDAPRRRGGAPGAAAMAAATAAALLLAAQRERRRGCVRCE